MTDKEKIKKICVDRTEAIVSFPGIDMKKFLYSIAGVESSWTITPKHRVEPAYSPPRGKYFLNNSRLISDRMRFGEIASASVGAFQIMFVTAKELGYTGTPYRLVDLDTNHFWACIFFKKRCKKKEGEPDITPEMLADAYNSGNYRDKIVPGEYIKKVMNYYKGEW